MFLENNIPYSATPFPLMVQTPFFVGYPRLEGLSEVAGPRDLLGTGGGGAAAQSNSPERACNAPPVERRYTGVRKMAYGRFSAKIGFDRCRYWLGTFDTAEEAARAYDAAARRLRGSNARTDFHVSPLPAPASPAAPACEEVANSLAHLLSSDADNDDGVNLDLTLKIGA